MTEQHLISDQGPRADNVRGVIVGGEYIAWVLLYDGRPQSGKFYADTEDEAIAQATARMAELRAEFCGRPCYLYPEDKWSVRLG